MNSMEVEPFKAPKILGDVFEAIIGAVFQDGGIDSINLVLKSLMAPFVLYVAKYSKSIQKEPKEDFQQLAVQLKIKPHFERINDQGEIPLSQVIGKELPPDEDICEKMVKVNIIHNNGQVMVSGYGSTCPQAEKNASINGIIWLRENKKAEIDELLKSSLFSRSLKACFDQHI